MFQCFPIVKPTGLGPLPLKPGTWHLRCPWTNRCGSEEGCRGWFQPAQPASHHPATRHGGANGRCQGNQGHPCKDGRTITWRLTLETWSANIRPLYRLVSAVVNCPAICVKMVPLNPISYCRLTPHFRHTLTSCCFIYPPIKYDKVIYPHEFGFPQVFGMLWYHQPCPMAAIGHEDVKLTLRRPRRMQVKLRKEVPK